jgi:hypothetical protein
MHHIVDLARYPVDAPDTKTGRDLIEACRATLDDRALCALPGFVHPEIVEQMVRETVVIAPEAFRTDKPRIAYISSDEAWPAGHPRTVAHPNRYYQLLNYQIPNGSLIRQLYLWEPLCQFLRQVLGYETLYRSACPHLALTVQLGGPGDCNGWHYDGNDAVFSLLLQQPGSGGAFEYVPNLRSEEDENYAAVAEVFAHPEGMAERPRLAPGTFTLFKGDLSLHRVTEIEDTQTRRIIALFSYDRTPNQVYQQQYIDELRGSPHAA